MEDEIREQVLNYCSLCVTLTNKKLNLQNILLLTLKHKEYMEVFMDIMGEDSPQECVKNFIKLDPNAFSPKTIAKHLAKKWVGAGENSEKPNNLALLARKAW